MKISNREFEKLVDEALALIPTEFRPYLDNVQIVIEDEPDDETLADIGLPAGETLYGLYTGTPLTERSFDAVMFPDRITIYRGPILEDFHERKKLRNEVARTVIHEIAHHFGIDDRRLAELDWD